MFFHVIIIIFKKEKKDYLWLLLEDFKDRWHIIFIVSFNKYDKALNLK
jgi:hypothetical protein